MIDFEALTHQKEYEKPEITLKQHWLIPLQLVFVALILAALPVFSWFFVANFLPILPTNQGFMAVWILGLSMYALMAVLYIFQTFLDYHLDIWIVTNERIISAERKSLFHYVTSEVRLYQIQDVTAETTGFFSSVLNFGTITVQTAAEIQDFHFENIPHPREVAKRILELVDIDRKFHKEKIIEAVEGVAI